MNDFFRHPYLKRSLAGLCALSVVLSALAAPAMAQSQLPSLGEAISGEFSVAAERRLGDQIMRDIRRDPDYLDDPVLLEYLQSVWQPLASAARKRGDITPEIDQRFAWEAFLVRDRSVNAFALPGGFVGMHLGLLAMTVTRDELASVLAHEMSHVTQRHIARGISNSKRQSLIGLAAMILGVLAASRSTRMDGASAIFSGGQAVAMQGQLNFSREMEREADRIGYGVMTSAGFASGGMAAMFEKLDQSSRLNDSGGFPYLRSHPLTVERIGEARARLGTSPGLLTNGLLAHTAAQARARVLMDSRVNALRRWQALDREGSGPQSPADKFANAYSSALASTLLRDWARADAMLQLGSSLLRDSPRSGADVERALGLLKAESFLARGDAARAVEALKPYVSNGTASSSRPLLLLAVQVALATPQDKEGLKLRADELNTWTTVHPGDALAWTQLSSCWQQLGLRLRAVRAEAESRVALGDLNGAVDRLRAGQRMARSSGSADFIEASVIDARLRDVEILRRQQSAQENPET